MAIVAALAELGVKKPGRSLGTLSLAQRQFTLGLANVWVHDTGLPLTRRFNAYESKEYGPFFDFVKLVISMLPIPNLREAQQQLGHKSVKTTEIYLRARAGEKVTPTK
jgi:hypothetical protein